MAVPARRKSSKKSREGRSVANLNFKKKAFSQLTECSNCKEPKILHQICSNCKNYRGRSF